MGAVYVYVHVRALALMLVQVHALSPQAGCQAAATCLLVSDAARGHQLAWHLCAIALRSSRPRTPIRTLHPEWSICRMSVRLAGLMFTCRREEWEGLNSL